MSCAPVDSVGTASSDVTRIEQEIDDALVTITIVDDDDDPRIVVERERDCEFVVDEADLAHPQQEPEEIPPWIEGLLHQIALRGIRMDAMRRGD